MRWAVCGFIALMLASPAAADGSLFGWAAIARPGPVAVGGWSQMQTRQSDPCALATSATRPTEGLRPAGGVRGMAGLGCKPARLRELRQAAQAVAALPLAERIVAIDRAVNAIPYVADSANWDSADYWATLAEFAARGGDCEDYASAKYALLRASGVAASAMRVVVVQDRWTGGAHAVLVVNVDGEDIVLDNQAAAPVRAAGETRYRPIYAVSEQRWWVYLPE
jgi:predicted transglutaminase-like cysteine proteinase